MRCIIFGLNHTTMGGPFLIRLATSADAGTIARHRARMFQDMGEVPPHLFEEFRGKSRDRLHDAIARGEYVGWLASLENDPKIVVGGAGLQLHRVLPHPFSHASEAVNIADGRHGIILNVFTEPEWRRRGVAALLLKRIIDWSRQNQLERLTLHASSEGRSLYERLGFVASNEMRFAGR
jgi:GNAT superfamily N-acetyltransferase